MKINVNLDRLFTLLIGLTAVLSLLKLIDVISCSWWIVFCPIWFSFIVFIIAITFVFALYKFKS